MGLSDTRVVVVCPEGNTAYCERITSPGLKQRFPDVITVEGVAKRLWRDPAGVTVVDPGTLVEAVRKVWGTPVQQWSHYLHRRYAW